MSVGVKALISPEYAAMNRQLHEDHEDYGVNAALIAGSLLTLIKNNDVRSLLDYGCGKGTLKPALLKLAPYLQIYEYDPAIPGKEHLPDVQPDLIAALDVMEHIEPDYLQAVFQSMISLKPKAVFLNISLTPAKKTLADGRNAHLIIQPAVWWREQLKHHFRAVFAPENETNLIFVGVPLA